MRHDLALPAENRLVGPQLLGNPIAGEGIEDFPVQFRSKKGLMLVLAVQVNQVIAELAELAERDQFSIDEATAAALSADFAAQDHFGDGLTGEEIPFPQKAARPGGIREVEEALDLGGLTARADVIGAGALAQHKIEGPDDDGLAGAGLARERRKALEEIEGQVVNDSQILDGQTQKHGKNPPPGLIVAIWPPGLQENFTDSEFHRGCAPEDFPRRDGGKSRRRTYRRKRSTSQSRNLRIRDSAGGPNLWPQDAAPVETVSRPSDCGVGGAAKSNSL